MVIASQISDIEHGVISNSTNTTARINQFSFHGTRGEPISYASLELNLSVIKIILANMSQLLLVLVSIPNVAGTTHRVGEIIEVLNEMAADAFDKIKASHCRVDVSRHPAMHKTDSIDYIILLKGDVTLILDEDEIDVKPFDTVVQRGTNHAWRNNGDEPALLIAVLIDSDIDA